MKLSQLSLADYNKLDSIPVINQDLSATDFTPVANTYYRHIGTTTNTFTQGVIYLYDTAYHKLGDSGGDYLTYKGDWATNTAYNVNDVVTYKGNLYEVLQNVTSVTTPDKDSTNYKAMTNTNNYSPYIPVTFDLMGGKIYGGDTVAPIQLVLKGNHAVLITTPYKDGATFDAWYTAPSGGDEINFGSTVINEPTTFYAQWI